MPITTTQVSSLSDNQDVKIIDTRPVEAYNGWRLENEMRGGHIKNARSLPLKWFNYIDWLDIVQSKNILPDHKLIIYGYHAIEAEKAANQFQKAGYKDVIMYNDFTDEWCQNTNLPMSRLKRYRQLVSAQWLQTLLTNGKAPECDNDRYIVCHAHYRNRSAYEEGHIPGAIELNTNTLESPETWNRRSPEEIKETLEQHGITCDTTVILYGRFSFPDNNDPFPGSSAGHLGAIRCAFIMMYAGVKDVRVLNGGLQSWMDAGFKISTENTPKQSISDFGAKIPQQPELMVDMPEAKQILNASDKNLVCVRSQKEFAGEVSGYNYIKKKGRIPGAVFGNCGSDAYHMENYRNLDHTTREYHEIEKLWKEVNITPDKHNAFYCGTGWRASEAFLNAWLMGWPRVSVFDGGWFEWSNDENNPYETGMS
jgi:3-mercaptopyruvate sulfurtransferase SseA